MPAVLLAGKADIADDADDSPAGDQYPEAFLPYAGKLVNKVIIIVDYAKLIVVTFIFFQVPVWRGS
jgi:hypothetical protein